MTRPIDEASLQASVDDRLSTADKSAVQAWLREHPKDARRLEDYRGQNCALHQAYDEILSEPVPAHLQAMVSNPPSRFAWMRYAAMVATLAIGAVVGGIAGWKMHGWQSAKSEVTDGTPTFVRQAAVSHAVYSPEIRHAVEVGADQEAHLVAWLSKRLGAQLRVPHLGAQGYALVGGRLLPGQPDNNSPVAQFMYQNQAKKRLTLYVHVEPAVSAAKSETAAFRFAQERGVGVFYWVESRFGYALSGDIDKSELLRVANAVYEQLRR